MRHWRTAAALAILFASGWLFLRIAAEIPRGMPGALLDQRIADWLQARTSPALTAALLVVTHLHSTLAMTLASAILGVRLWVLRQRSWIAALVLAVPGGLLINALLKDTYQRARPSFDPPLLDIATYSFPSGHVAGATLFYGFLVAWLWDRLRHAWARAAALAGAVAMVALVAFSRLYLGVHFLTDVLGAAAWSLGWLAACLAVGRVVRPRSGGLAR